MNNYPAARRFSAEQHGERWLHDIDPPASDRRIVWAMFLTVLATFVVAIVVGLGLQSAVADRVAVLVGR